MSDAALIIHVRILLLFQFLSRFEIRDVFLQKFDDNIWILVVLFAFDFFRNHFFGSLSGQSLRGSVRLRSFIIHIFVVFVS